MLIKNDTRKELEQLAREASPYEAVGIISHDGSVYPLPNRHKEPQSAFELHKQDLIELIEYHPELVLTELTLWHSHPSGGVGPSRVDMQNKTPIRYHLVVTLLKDGIELTFY